MFSSQQTSQQTSGSPSLWDKLTGQSAASHSTTSTSRMDAIANPDANISTPYNVSAGATGASMNNDSTLLNRDSSLSNANTQTKLMEIDSTLPVSSTSSSYQSSSYSSPINTQSTILDSSASNSSYSQSSVLGSSSVMNNNQSLLLNKNSAVDTCTKCITTTGPMVTMTGVSVVDVNQTAQVHFVGQQTNATISHESAALQVQVPAQTITTTLPAKRVIVEVPARQVQVTVPGRIVQLENAPEIQVTTRPVIKAVAEVSAQIRQGLAVNSQEYNNSLVSNTNTIQNA